MAVTQGFHHVGLSIFNMEATRDFFIQVLGFVEVGSKPDYPAVFVSDGHTMITLWQTKSNARPFDRKNQVGLHHIALKVGQNLASVYAQCAQAKGVTVDFAPEPLGESGLQHCMLFIPGGIRLELVSA